MMKPITSLQIRTRKNIKSMHSAPKVCGRLVQKDRERKNEQERIERIERQEMLLKKRLERK